MPEINLLQNRVTNTGSAWKGQANLVLGILLALLILLGAGGAGLLILKGRVQAKVDGLTQQNTILQTNLTNQQKNLGSAKQFQAQLANVRVLLNQHVYMTILLAEIEKVTYAKAQYTSIDASNIGLIHLEGNVTDYTSLAKLILSLNSSEKFNDVRLMSINPSSGDTNNFQFSIDLKVDKEIFVKN